MYLPVTRIDQFSIVPHKIRKERCLSDKFLVDPSIDIVPYPISQSEMDPLTTISTDNPTIGAHPPNMYYQVRRPPDCFSDNLVFISLKLLIPHSPLFTVPKSPFFNVDTSSISLAASAQTPNELAET